MDFKALMASRIASAKPSSGADASSKYQRRSQVESARQAAYTAEQAKLEQEREEKAARKRKLEEEEAEQTLLREEKRRKLAEESQARRKAEEAEQERLRRKRLGLPEVSEQSEGSEDATTPLENQPDIPDEDLQTKLRSLNQPTKLYDESHPARLKRYYKSTAVAKKKRYTNGPIPTTLEPVSGENLLLPTKIPAKETPEYAYLHRQIASYFTLLLSEWSNALSKRPSEVKVSQSGKMAEQTYLSVIRDLTPLYRKLESQTIALDLLKPIVEIAHNAQSRRYVDANDGYLRLSIGKAAWPIGVTMVGIHERSAREKLHQGEGEKQAHILSDEVTRKMLQSIKRCLSFAQTRWPPEDVGQLMG